MRPVISRGIDSGDRVILVRPAAEGSDDRGQDAADYVADMISEVAPSASVTTERVDTDEFMETVLQCSDILQAVAQDRTVLVNFGGGAREVLLPLLIATIIHAPLVDSAVQYTDIDQDVRDVPVPDLTMQLPRNAVGTFALLVDLEPPVTLPALAGASPQSKSTVSRHIDALASAGVVETSLEDNTKQVSISPTGQLVARSGAVSNLRDP